MTEDRYLLLASPSLQSNSKCSPIFRPHCQGFDTARNELVPGAGSRLPGQPVALSRTATTGSPIRTHGHNHAQMHGTDRTVFGNLGLSRGALVLSVGWSSGSSADCKFNVAANALSAFFAHLVLNTFRQCSLLL
jgi:hypothetical protein